MTGGQPRSLGSACSAASTSAWRRRLSTPSVVHGTFTTNRREVAALPTAATATKVLVKVTAWVRQALSVPTGTAAATSRGATSHIHARRGRRYRPGRGSGGLQDTARAMLK